VKKRYTLVVERSPLEWRWAIWATNRVLAAGNATTKAIALKIGRIVRDAYEKEHRDP
jgi:hypothetical protein